jgi:hypothetical protein
MRRPMWGVPPTNTDKTQQPGGRARLLTALLLVVGALAAGIGCGGGDDPPPDDVDDEPQPAAVATTVLAIVNDTDGPVAVAFRSVAGADADGPGGITLDPYAIAEVALPLDAAVEAVAQPQPGPDGALPTALANPGFVLTPAAGRVYVWDVAGTGRFRLTRLLANGSESGRERDLSDAPSGVYEFVADHGLLAPLPRTGAIEKPVRVLRPDAGAGSAGGAGPSGELPRLPPAQIRRLLGPDLRAYLPHDVAGYVVTLPVIWQGDDAAGRLIELIVDTAPPIAREVVALAESTPLTGLADLAVARLETGLDPTADPLPAGTAQALVRVLAAQGRPAQVIDLLDRSTHAPQLRADIRVGLTRAQRRGRPTAKAVLLDRLVHSSDPVMRQDARRFLRQTAMLADPLVYETLIYATMNASGMSEATRQAQLDTLARAAEPVRESYPAELRWGIEERALTSVSAGRVHEALAFFIEQREAGGWRVVAELLADPATPESTRDAAFQQALRAAATTRADDPMLLRILATAATDPTWRLRRPAFFALSRPPRAADPAADGYLRRLIARERDLADSPPGAVERLIAYRDDTLRQLAHIGRIARRRAAGLTPWWLGAALARAGATAIAAVAHRVGVAPVPGDVDETHRRLLLDLIVGATDPNIARDALDNLRRLSTPTSYRAALKTLLAGFESASPDAQLVLGYAAIRTTAEGEQLIAPERLGAILPKMLSSEVAVLRALAFDTLAFPPWPADSAALPGAPEAIDRLLIEAAARESTPELSAIFAADLARRQVMRWASDPDIDAPGRVRLLREAVAADDLPTAQTALALLDAAGLRRRSSRDAPVSPALLDNPDVDPAIRLEIIDRLAQAEEFPAATLARIHRFGSPAGRATLAAAVARRNARRGDLSATVELSHALAGIAPW